MAGKAPKPNGDEGQKYDAAEAWCREVVKSGHELLFDAKVFYRELASSSVDIGLPLESLHSFLRNIHIIHVKKSAHVLRGDMRRHLRDYRKGKSIRDIARTINYPPYMVARLIVENIVNFDGLNSRKAVTEAMRDPEGKLGNPLVVSSEFRDSEALGPGKSIEGEARTIPSSHQKKASRLSVEVIDAISSDPLYGPRQDRDRHAVGLEYEIILEQALSSLKIPFETEAQLRIKGTARTPDILLSCPVGVRIHKRSPMGRSHGAGSPILQESFGEDDSYEWKVVCWIDSKALFGDVQTHNVSVLPQAETYVHRFGPGLVLYWFGHAPLDRLGDGHGDVVVTGWNLPDFFMLPTGQIIKT